MNGWPASQCDRQPKQSTDRKKHDSGDGICLDKFLSCPVNFQTGCRAGTVIENFAHDLYPLLDNVNLAYHRVVADSAEFVTDNTKLTRFIGLDGHDYVVPGVNLNIDIDGL